MTIPIPSHRSARMRHLQQQINGLASSSPAIAAAIASYVAWNDELAFARRAAVLDAGHQPDEFIGVTFTDLPDGGLVAEAQEKPTPTTGAAQPTPQA
jgi:hypothetical protein